MSTTTPRISQLRTLEAEAVFVIREVVAELARPVLLFSGGKDSIALLRIAEKAFRPLPLPFPVLHVDTGSQLPRGDRVPRPAPARGGPPIDCRVRPGVDRRRARQGGGAGRFAQPAADGDPARCARGASDSMPLSAVPGATRSAHAPRSGCSRSATSSGSGSRERNARSRGRSTTHGFVAVSTFACSR